MASEEHIVLPISDYNRLTDKISELKKMRDIEESEKLKHKDDNLYNENRHHEDKSSTSSEINNDVIEADSMDLETSNSANNDNKTSDDKSGPPGYVSLDLVEKIKTKSKTKTKPRVSQKIKKTITVAKKKKKNYLAEIKKNWRKF